MIQQESRLPRGRQLGCQGDLVHPGARWHPSARYASIGDIIIATVKDAIPGASVKKGDVVKCVVVRTKKEEGAVPTAATSASTRTPQLLINDALQPHGTRIFRPVGPRAVRDRRFMRIVSLAPEVL